MWDQNLIVLRMITSLYQVTELQNRDRAEYCPSSSCTSSIECTSITERTRISRFGTTVRHCCPNCIMRLRSPRLSKHLPRKWGDGCSICVGEVVLYKLITLLGAAILAFLGMCIPLNCFHESLVQGPCCMYFVLYRTSLYRVPQGPWQALVTSLTMKSQNLAMIVS